MNSSTYYQAVSYLKTGARRVDSQQNNTAYVQKSYSIEQKNSKSSDIWAELVEKYDVRNATFEEISEATYKLYEAGEVSFQDLTVLTFDWNRAAKYLRQNVKNATVPIRSDLNLTSANAEGKRDWIAEYKARVKRDLDIGNLLGYANNQSALKILNRLDEIA